MKRLFFSPRLPRHARHVSHNIHPPALGVHWWNRCWRAAHLNMLIAHKLPKQTSTRCAWCELKTSAISSREKDLWATKARLIAPLLWLIQVVCIPLFGWWTLYCFSAGTWILSIHVCIYAKYNASVNLLVVRTLRSRLYIPPPNPCFMAQDRKNCSNLNKAITGHQSFWDKREFEYTH